VLQLTYLNGDERKDDVKHKTQASQIQIKHNSRDFQTASLLAQELSKPVYTSS
jgi:hypothetical protein